MRNSIDDQINIAERKLQLLQELRDLEDQEHGGPNYSDFSNRGNRGDYQSQRGSTNQNRGSTSGRDRGLRNRDGSVDERQFNTGRRNVSGGSNDASDDRTTAGRMAHDAEEFSYEELMDILENPPQDALNEDGTFDRRTKEGRALYAAGLIDDEGNPIEQSRGRNRGNMGSRSRSTRGD